VDPVTCPTLISTSSGPCARITTANQLNSNGGNIDLGPETAKQASLGIVFEPSRNFSASLDWWTINRDNTIISPSLQQLLVNYAFFADRFTRNSSGIITAFDIKYANAGSTRTQGLELSLRGGLDGLGGRISGGLDGTYLLKKQETLVVGQPFTNLVGVWSLAGDLGLRWKHNAFVSYSNDTFNISLSQIFRNGYKNRVLPGVASGLAVRSDIVYDVEDYITYNLSLGIKVQPGLKITAGIKNILNTDPPFSISYDDNTGGGSSWEPRVADPRGRAFTLLLETKF
jgi:iron complex outermembrane recepter protein